jgi:hypothetical protein
MNAPKKPLQISPQRFLLKTQIKTNGSLDAVHHVRENVADRGAQQGQNDDHDHGHQNEDESVLYQTLAFFFGSE